jgi:exonuclease III
VVGLKKNYTTLFSGLKALKGQHGTGYLITGCAAQCVLGFEPINGRMCKLRITGKFCSMAIISVYAATEDENKHSAEDVERFYNRFSDVWDKHQEVMP